MNGAGAGGRSITNKATTVLSANEQAVLDGNFLGCGVGGHCCGSCDDGCGPDACLGDGAARDGLCHE